MRKVISALCAMLSGCATLETQSTINIAEGTWQVAHVIDVAQTFHGAASDQCYKEGDPITRAIVGEHPNHGGVIAWGIAYSALHYGVTAILMEHDHPRIALIWEAITIADVVRTDAHNYSIGIRIGRPNTDYPECPPWARGVPP